MAKRAYGVVETVKGGSHMLFVSNPDSNAAHEHVKYEIGDGRVAIEHS